MRRAERADAPPILRILPEIDAASFIVLASRRAPDMAQIWSGWFIRARESGAPDFFPCSHTACACQHRQLSASSTTPPLYHDVFILLDVCKRAWPMPQMPQGEHACHDDCRDMPGRAAAHFREGIARRAQRTVFFLEAAQVFSAVM